MALHHETGGSNASSTWGEAAAVQLLQLKHHQPSRTECHAASELLHIILQSTGDSSHPSLASRRRPALLGATDDATPLTEENSMMPFKKDATSNYDLPMPLADSRDDRYLSPLQCYIRKHCVEYFAATASNAGTKGRQTPISEGRVGVRCVFCKHLFRDQQAAQATSFPNKLASIYSSAVMLQCRHFPNCKEIPNSVRENLAALKMEGNSAANTYGTKRQEYWTDIARDMGLVDTDGGIRFIPRDAEASTDIASECKTWEKTTLPLPHTNDIAYEASVRPALGLPERNIVSPFEPTTFSPASIDYELLELLAKGELVSLQDRDLVPDYILLALAQLQRCNLGADDRIGVWREREIGSIGLCCRHCRGGGFGPGKGRYFPNSPRSLAQTTTTQTIVKHITTKCHHVPQTVKDAISSLQQAANEDSQPPYAPKSTNDDRPKYGSRKEFFQRIWDRLHGFDREITSAQPNGGPVLIASQNFSGPKIKIIRPTPIRRVLPVSSDTPHRSDVSSVVESLHLNHDLFDDKNRRVTITGVVFSTDEGTDRYGEGFVGAKRLKASR